MRADRIFCPRWGLKESMGQKGGYPMAACPEGHDSISDDFCDICGTRIGGDPAPSLGRTIGKYHQPGPGATNGGQTCPGCGAPVSGQFCEACGISPWIRRPLGPPASPADAYPSSGSSAGPPESLFPPISRPDPLSAPWRGLESALSPRSPQEPSRASWGPTGPSPASWSPAEPPPSSWSRPEPSAGPAAGSGRRPLRESSRPRRKSPDHKRSPPLRTCWHRCPHRLLRPVLNRHSHSWLP